MEKNRIANCAPCKVLQCWHPKPEGKFPKNCTRIHYEDLVEQTIEEGFTNPEARKLNAAAERLLIEGVDAERGAQWSRVEELIHFMEYMEYQKIGLALCTGLAKEAAILNSILEKHGFDVVSVNCMAGAITRGEVQQRYSVETISEPNRSICNPVMQAEILNREKTEFNVMFGLCLGHDTIFIKYSDADVTPLVVKDRVLYHNPIGALHLVDTYYRKKL
jgi:uncharacterized metal-binding protein